VFGPCVFLGVYFAKQETLRMQDDTETPLWMRGNYAPVGEETTAFDLPVERNIPPELCGLYARNGANPRDGVTGHWFLGDGMVHGVSIRDGKAEWYRNRWVRTPCFFGQKLTVENALDIRCSVANTSVVPFGNRIFTLAENALPMEITRELDTVGFHDFGGALKSPFTAHPKICPRTGELHFFGYRVVPPFLTYYAASADGTLLRSLEVPVKGPTMMHDFALTSNHVIFMELPVVFDLQRALNASIPFTWSESYGARLGVLPRDADIEKLRWVEIEPCYVYHVANAFETADGTIVLDVARYESEWRPDGKRTGARLSRWRIPPGASKVVEEQLDDQKIEFPRIDDRNVGKPHAVVYALANNRDLENGSFGGLLRYDLTGGETQYHDFGEGRTPSEFALAAVPGAGTDEGWLIGFVYDRARDASELAIFDAQRVRAGPVARILLPKRVPQGFHGAWIPGA
jgi:carotenoid cleavage dioxygenase-like enzyme